MSASQTYSLTTAYYPHGQSLLIEGFDAKEILLDIVQIAVSTGAIVGTGGAGGDVVTDAVFASSEAAAVLTNVVTIFDELGEIGLIIKSAAALDFSGNPLSFYNEVNGLVKKVVASAIAGNKAKELIETIEEKITAIISKIVRAISKWIAALLPDDFGLSGPAFEATMSGVLTATAENSYNLAVAGVEALGETGKLLTDSKALEAFLTKIVESIIAWAEGINEVLQAPEDDEATWGGFAMQAAGEVAKANLKYSPLGGAVKAASWVTGNEKLDDFLQGKSFEEQMRNVPASHPMKKLYAKLMPKAIFLLGEIRDDWIPTTAEVMHKLISWLFAALAIFQMVMNPTEREKLLKIQTKDVEVVSGADLLKQVDDREQKKLAAHRYRSEDQMIIERWQKLAGLLEG